MVGGTNAARTRDYTGCACAVGGMTEERACAGGHPTQRSDGEPENAGGRVRGRHRCLRGVAASQSMCERSSSATPNHARRVGGASPALCTLDCPLSRPARRYGTRPRRPPPAATVAATLCASIPRSTPRKRRAPSWRGCARDGDWHCAVVEPRVAGSGGDRLVPVCAPV